MDFDELKVQEIWNNEQLESVKSGDVVAAFKDYCMVWDEVSHNIGAMLISRTVYPPAD